MDKAIITVVGKDAIGIIGKVCTDLSQQGVNVLDISQTILDGFFTMMMIVDCTACRDDFDALSKRMESLGEDIGVSIRCQREEIFTRMHRV